MAAPKGKIPAHVREKQKRIDNPETTHPFLAILSDIEDPRKPSLFFKYPLISVLFMTSMAVICGATDWAKVVVMSKGMADWLAQYVDMVAGVPCERTFTNIFNVIKPEALEKALRSLSELLKKGIATKQCAAACDPSYRDKVLKKLF